MQSSSRLSLDRSQLSTKHVPCLGVGFSQKIITQYIRRLVEASYFAERAAPSDEALGFWLQEARTPGILVELARGCTRLAEARTAERPLLVLALAGDYAGLESALEQEERAERARDRLYWEPLRRQLETLRRSDRRRRE